MSENRSINSSRPAIHPDAYQWLAADLQNGTIPHALLFSGIEGTGKKEAAIDFAMACNCRDENRPAIALPCKSCRSCRKILADHHADMIEIKPSGQFIKIAQIRKLCHDISMKPLEAKWRFIVIRDAHTMNPSSSNALLKMLEEPPDRTVFILMTDQKAGLLDTVISRCKAIRFAPIAADRLARILVEEYTVAPNDATITASMADGSMTKALRLNRIQWLHYRNWLLGAMGWRNPHRQTDSFIRTRMVIAEKIAHDKEKLATSLEILLSWLRDLLMVTYYPEKIIHRDLIETIKQNAKQWPVRSILSKIERTQEVQKKILQNINLRLTAEILLFRI